MRAIVLAALLLSTSAAAYDPVADTRAILAGTVTTTKVKNEYLSGKRDTTAVFKGALNAYKAVRAAEAPVTPVPVSGWVPSPTLAGAAPLVAAFDINLALAKAQTIPEEGSYSPDEGAFRFICGGEGPLKSDDPLLYPNQPGKSHLHKFWGATTIDASSTPESLGKASGSNCNYGQYTLNRSAYWMPALLDDQNFVRNPDLVAVYYKRPRKVSKYCQEGSSVRMGICTDLPNSIRFIFGWDPTKPDAPQRGMTWYCTTGTGKHVTNLDDLFGKEGCSAGATMVANLIAPPCWDGKNLDSPDHRTHIAFQEPVLGAGYEKCPSTHPYLIPQTENKVMWTVTADMIGTRSDGSKYSRIKLASDHMKVGAKPGETMHADYIEQWVAAVKKMWHDNCIEKGLDCSGGDLGNGLQLYGAYQPAYGWTQPADKARVAIPTS